MVLDLRSHPPLGSSDHVVLTFTLRCYAEVEQVTTLKPALHRGDYGAMVQMAREATWPVSDGCTVDQHYRAFQEVLDGICERGIPRQHPGGRKRNLYMTREALTLQNRHARRHEPQLERLGDINNMVEQVNEFGDVLCDCKKGCLRVLAGGAATLRSLCWR
ncbi:hypothetical protein FJT64_008837 [Amphibalanus amphitrite]|uniref:Uncharacterized protein n=1 Tax=Amphibalanus amphitrite TaxID=1232801 RepID=A0A6A4VI28_AMPAM|nr:hypothetical protein FJT64_008837 [Amphibalanus amphitrite]